METRKHLPRAVLARIYFIDREIASGKYPNVNDLAGEYEVGTATIYRDIEYMRDMLDAPIEYDAKHRGWYYTEKSFRLPARFASASDMLALGMAKSLLSLYRNTPLYDSARRLLDDITAPLSPEEANGAARKEWYEDRIIVPAVASVPVNNELWDVIVSALKENRLLTFEYKGLWDDDYKTRLVRPYQLLFDTGVWYLYGYAEERSAIRVFSLSRMQNPALTNETFTLPEDFDYTTKNEGSYFGVFLGEKKHFRIEFDFFAEAELLERQWAADQKIEALEDSVIIDFSSTQYEKVLRWVLSFGACAYPLEPPELVTQWEAHVRGMYEQTSAEARE